MKNRLPKVGDIWKRLGSDEHIKITARYSNLCMFESSGKIITTNADSLCNFYEFIIGTASEVVIQI